MIWVWLTILTNIVIEVWQNLIDRSRVLSSKGMQMRDLLGAAITTALRDRLRSPNG